MGKPIWALESILKKKENILIELLKSAATPVDDSVIESFADALAQTYLIIFNRQKFIERCRETQKLVK